MGLGSFIHEWRSLSRFRGLPTEARSIVFYAEDAGSWGYFEPIISEITGSHGKKICYVTSSHSDPILKRSDERIQSFCIGSGTVRTIFFVSLQASTMVMTMPDLDTYHFKRSKNPVQYFYVYHSLVSTHMAYRPGAFDNYDHILCVGPHHKDEIRATEALHGLKPKNLIEGGYVILDSILKSAPDEKKTSEDGRRRILVAPSWGDIGLIESCGPELVEVLLEAGFKVTVRPHVMTIRQRHPALSELEKRFAANPDFRLDLGLESQGTVSESDIMISDWSGAAFEYALGLEKPVIFVDVPKKVNNPNYEEIPQVPLEVMLRSKIGEVVPPDRLSEIPAAVERLCKTPDFMQRYLQELRAEWVYNVGSSAEVSAGHIVQSADLWVANTKEVQ